MIINVPLDLINPNPWQTRAVVDSEAVQELAMDIAAHGLLQTPVGRLVKDGMRLDLVQTTEITVQFNLAKALEQAEVKVQLAFGHRRLEAFWNNLRENRSSSEITDWTSMPVEIQVLGDQEMAAYAWSENEKRLQHTPLERALAIQKRIEDFGWTQAEAADFLGISRPAVSNSLRLLKLPEEVTAALGKGELSERQAIALAGLYELPEEFLRSAQERYYDGHPYRPDEIVRLALEGASSDQIRDKVNGLARSFGKDLQGQIWTLDEVLERVDVRSATCRECERRLKERNICLDGSCFQVKKDYFQGLYLQAAAEKAGLQPLDPAAAEYVTEFRWVREFETIRRTGCDNLKLKYEPGNGQKRRDDLQELGYPNAVVVCSKRAGSCSCLKGIDYAKQQERMSPSPQPSPQGRGQGEGEQVVYEAPVEVMEVSGPSAEELQELARQARSEKRNISKAVEKVKEGLAQMLDKGLAENERGAWLLLGNKLAYQISDESTEGLEAEQVRRMVCEQLAGRLMPYDPSTESGLISYVNSQLERAGLRPLALLDDGTLGEAERFPGNAVPDFLGGAMIGMLWFDNSSSDLYSKVQRAVDYYLKKYGRMPNRCFVHPGELREGTKQLVGPVELVGNKNVRPGHFWLGCEEAA